MPVDYHIHLERGPLSLDYLRQFVQVAQERGIREIGFSEHPHHFLECRAIYPADNLWVEARCAYSLDTYVYLVESAKQEGLPVKLGMEWDYVPGHEEEVTNLLEAYPWDYAIGSVHWLRNVRTWWGVDNREHRQEWEEQGVAAVYRQYFQLVEAAALSGLFDVVGHLDVVKVFGDRPAEDLTPLYEQVAGTLARAGVCVEVSSAGLHKPVGEVYPGPELLAILARLGVPIVTSSDAHEPQHVGRDFDQVVALAKEAGYTEVWTFTQRERSPIPLALR